MSYTPQRFPLLSLALAAALAIPVLAADLGSAHADVGIRVSGSVKVRVATPRVRVRVRQRAYVPPPPPPTLYTGGYYGSAGVYVGGFAEPPPPLPACDADCGQPSAGCYAPQPSYPAAACPPDAQSACGQPAATCWSGASASRPRLPRWGIGFFAGSTEVEGGPVSEEVGVIARRRLTRRLHIEGEVAKSEIADSRIDRRLGGALVYEFKPWSRFSPQVLAGIGRSMVEVGTAAGSWQSGHEYGELGLGLSYRLTPRLQVAGDFRAGVRAPLEDEPADAMVKSLVPSAETEERYTRGRLSLLLSF